MGNLFDTIKISYYESIPTPRMNIIYIPSEKPTRKEIFLNNLKVIIRKFTLKNIALIIGIIAGIVGIIVSIITLTK